MKGNNDEDPMLFYYLAGATSLAGMSLWWYLKEYKNRKKEGNEGKQQSSAPPGPRPLPIIGNVLEFSDPSKELFEVTLLKLTLKYGSIFRLSMPFFGVMTVTTDPELVRRAYISKNYEKDWTYKLLSPLLGSRSMIAVPKEEWAPKRRSFNPGFAPTFLKQMVQVMVDKLERLHGCIRDDMKRNGGGSPTNMLERAQTFTSDVIVSIGFHEDWGGDKPHPARVWMTEIALLLDILMASPVMQVLGLTYFTKRKIRQYETMLDQEMLSIVERRLKGSTSSSSGSGAATASDICSLAIDQMRQENGELSEEDKIAVSHQLKTFYFAGHDTTASTIAWAIWFLSQHNDILDKVRTELMEQNIWTAQSEQGGEPSPTYEQLQACTYLEAVVKETLRLYPPASILSRQIFDLDETYKGYHIGGTVLLVAVYAMHRSPNLWQDPDAFRPERFLDGSEEDLNSKFMPFSRGPRDCIGKYFAMLEAKLAISALVTRYDFECVDPSERMASQMTMRPENGAQVRFSYRT